MASPLMKMSPERGLMAHPGVQLRDFSTTCVVNKEDCEDLWLAGGCGSVVRALVALVFSISYFPSKHLNIIMSCLLLCLILFFRMV